MSNRSSQFRITYTASGGRRLAECSLGMAMGMRPALCHRKSPTGFASWLAIWALAISQS
jgi:hypothetical protein